MTYAVSVDTCLPKGARDLDPLQREGVLHLLGKGLESIERIDGPDGMEIEIVDELLAAHPRGALLKLFVDAPALEIAEGAIREVVQELLEESELLADWEITKCEVELHPELAQESLDAADGPDAPPADPGERARRHAEERPATAFPGLDDAEVEAMRLKLRALAPRLQAFSLASFGYREDEEGGCLVAREDAEVAAGALVYAIDIFVDGLFDDAATLDEAGASVADCEEVLMVLEDLPSQFALQYTPLFARRLTVTAVAMTARFTQSGFVRLSCVAEELLLRLLLTEAEVVADSYALLGDGVRAAWEAFAAEVYEDMDHEWLYQPAMDGIDEDPAFSQLGIAPMGIKDWFTPFNGGRYVHPYAANEDGEEPEAGSAG